MAYRIDSPVFQPVVIGGLYLKNRIVMAPMTRSRSDNVSIPGLSTDCKIRAGSTSTSRSGSFGRYAAREISDWWNIVRTEIANATRAWR